MVGMINISFALIGFLCMILPFVLFFYAKDKLWCKYYCPRAGLFTKLLSKVSLNKKMPKWLTAKKTKNIVLIYYGINMLIATKSSIMVANGLAEPMEVLRFFIFFKMPFSLPQLLDLSLSPLVAHVSYRLYSMMFTSIVIGLGFGITFRPRTWCIICPVQTLTSIDISKKKGDTSAEKNTKRRDECA
jgi:polyferredoxin